MAASRALLCLALVAVAAGAHHRRPEHPRPHHDKHGSEFVKGKKCSEQTLRLHLSKHCLEALDNFEGQI
ncbi:hypothetical protein EVAR_68254_1 [Eumeta japonica]|uniref:Uncharacterized protein n=1 Tax=Eumeta variegata TaxID=151549 RepID=A0A4C1ZQ28_EUMVA|nr:hypothetical protein EVAR_68254_1 [Eumeta japonica]